MKDVSYFSVRPWQAKPRCASCRKRADFVIGHWIEPRDAFEASLDPRLGSVSDRERPDWQYIGTYACSVHYDPMSGILCELIGVVTGYPARETWLRWLRRLSLRVTRHEPLA